MEAKHSIRQFPLREAWLILAIGLLMLVAAGGGYVIRLATSPAVVVQHSAAATQPISVPTIPGPDDTCVIPHHKRGGC